LEYLFAQAHISLLISYFAGPASTYQ
jgi:hypothetical protein